MSGAASLHAFAIEIVSSAGGADSDESDFEPLQLVRAIATSANATVALQKFIESSLSRLLAQGVCDQSRLASRLGNL